MRPHRVHDHSDPKAHAEASAHETRRNWPPLLVVGLTGGIASGKTTVAGMFRDLGATVLNADHLGKEIVNPGEPALAELVLAFGTDFLKSNGQLDRRALGQRVFSSRRDLQKLNRVTHPRIAHLLARQLTTLARTPPTPAIVVVEAAVLIEAGWAPLVDRIIVVTVQQTEQAARLIAGSGLTADQAWSRIRSQLPVRERLRYADHRISNSGSLNDTALQVAGVWQQLTGGP